MTNLSLFSRDVVDANVDASTMPALVDAGVTEPPALAGVSACGLYRYWLSRCWGDASMRVCFCMLNPSTALGSDDKGRPVDDATIRRCIGFGKAWGYGALDVVNFFAWRETHPQNLVGMAERCRRDGAPSIIGPENDEHIRERVERAELVVIASGDVHKALAERAHAVIRRLRALAPTKLRMFGLTKSGWPKHPVRLANASVLVPLEGT